MDIGYKHEEYGELSAKMIFGGERYYFFTKNGDTSMMPASMFEEETK